MKLINNLKKVFSKDGTENKEHILDLIKSTKVLYENLQNNTDISIKMLEKEIGLEDKDYDLVDAITLLCQEIVKCEKDSKEFYDKLEDYEKSIEDGNIVEEKEIQIIYDKFKDLERVSKSKMENIIKSCKLSETARKKRKLEEQKQTSKKQEVINEEEKDDKIKNNTRKENKK